MDTVPGLVAFLGFQDADPGWILNKNGGIHQLEVFILNVENMVPGKSLLLEISPLWSPSGFKCKT